MENMTKTIAEEMVRTAELGTNRKGWHLIELTDTTATLELIEEYTMPPTIDQHVLTINLQTKEVEYITYSDTAGSDETLHPGFCQAGLDYLQEL